MLNELPDPFSFYQLVGWIPFFIFIASFQVLDPKKTIFLWIISGGFYVLHYYGLGAFIPMWLSVSALLRDFVAVYGTQKHLKYAVIANILFAISICALVGSEPHDYLSALGSVSLAISSLNRDHFWSHRLFAVLHQVFWFGAFISMGSYAGLAMIICSFGSNIIGMIRYKLRASASTS